mmetsp:Transcript_18793/g.48013  ORF Transcript_18793/g.48013 Transcript_18793/m.48013 type:complete len:222 (-) Transcript_18793:126-791(-)
MRASLLIRLGVDGPCHARGLHDSVKRCAWRFFSGGRASSVVCFRAPLGFIVPPDAARRQEHEQPSGHTNGSGKVERQGRNTPTTAECKERAIHHGPCDLDQSMEVLPVSSQLTLPKAHGRPNAGDACSEGHRLRATHPVWQQRNECAGARLDASKEELRDHHAARGEQRMPACAKHSHRCPDGERGEHAAKTGERAEKAALGCLPASQLPCEHLPGVAHAD